MDDVMMHDTLRMSQPELRALLDELNRGRGNHKGASRRGSKRWGMQFQRIVVTVYTEFGDPANFVSMPRNLSSTGLGLIHGSYLHPGTRVAMMLRALDGRGRVVTGRVVRCAHLRGSLHEVGVEFDEHVNPRDFFICFGEDYIFQAESVDPSRLTGRVLVVEDSRDDQRLMSHHLRETGIELEFVEDAASGLERLGEHPAMVFLDYDLPDMDGIEFLLEADRRGSLPPVVLVSAYTDRELRDAAIAAGAKEMLLKPYERRDLLRAAAEYLLAGEEGVVADDAIVSDADPELVSAEQVAEYVRDLRQKAKELYEAGSEGDTERAIEVLRGVAASAELHGFASLTSYSAGAIKALREEPLARARRALNQAIESYRRAQPARGSRGAPGEAA